MENKEKNLQNAFNYVRTFYREVAQMMDDMIELMNKEGWEVQSSSITDGLSYSLDLPDQWGAYYIYKNFSNKKFDEYFKGILIFFDETMNDFPISIVCGCVHEPIKSIDKFALYWLCKNNRESLKKLTGEVIELETEYEKKRIKGEVFALPLAMIKSREDLKEKIVKKLLELK